ncbi:hypothetical protein, partial [Methanosarcina mazei]|uniref:hypothetical protein n=1 Tax=Methanosarcina mazei TaxID=2209 RepID=UPI0019110305
GWYLCPGAFTTPNSSQVACMAAPSHDHAKPVPPCSACLLLQGLKWSEDKAPVNPAFSAS